MQQNSPMRLMRTNPRIVTQARPTPSLPAKTSSHQSRALPCLGESELWAWTHTFRSGRITSYAALTSALKNMPFCLASRCNTAATSSSMVSVVRIKRNLMSRKVISRDPLARF